MLAIARRACGFTLLELIIVLFILAMSVALLVPRLGDNQALLLKTEVREIAALLNYARRDALVSGSLREVLLYPPVKDALDDRKRRNLQAGRWRSRGAALSFSDGKKKVEIEMKKPLKLSFYPAGGARGGTLTLQRGELEARIDINPLTAKLDIQLPE